MSKTGRETVFSGELSNEFINPIPHQKKRPLEEIEKKSKAHLAVLESNPAQEFLKEKKLVDIYRNTYETTIQKHQKQKNIQLDLLAESKVSVNETEKPKTIRVFKSMVGLEANSAPLKYEVCEAKRNRVEKIMNSELIKERLGGEYLNIVKEKNNGTDILIKATQENVVNNKNNCHKFKVAVDKKKAFYAN